MLRVAHTDQVVKFSEKLSKVVAQERVEKNASLMLHSLYFAQMNERYDRVAVAHEKTFNWVFDNTSDPSVPESKFVPWLEDRHDLVHLYWVTGKAGSGKSTLMRFLCDDRRTKQYLELWAAPHKLMFASCFFWNPGHRVQRSLTGLLQSLLHEMLCQCRDLICIASPWRWQWYDLGAPNSYPWSTTELLHAFRRVIEGTKDSVKWFMLIDGLDEFEGDDKARTEINDLFTSIAPYQHVKVCLSSRPWNIFEDAFEGLPSLRLERLTYNDIKDYVQAEIGGNHRFKALSSKNPTGCSRLIATIVEKAAGVFLWVYLVTALLLAGIRDGDSIPELQRRLDHIPPDLEDYFKHMIGGLEAIYLQQACHLFQIALKSNSLSLLTYSYTQEEDPDYAINIQFGCISDPDLHERLEWMKRRLNSRCKGLLEVYTDPKHKHRFFDLKVDFLHRSVRDFLQTPFASTVLEQQTDASFDVDVELCKSYLIQLKTIKDSYNESSFSMSRSLLADFLLRVRKFEQENDKPLCHLMDHLDQSFTLLWQQSRPSSASNANHWSNHILCNERADPYLKRTFLSFALAAGLHVYVKSKLESDTSLVEQKRGRPLLDCALRPCYGENARIDAGISYGQDKPDVEIVALIMAQGADPNQPFEGFTVWRHWLLDLHAQRKSLETLPKTLQARSQITHSLIKAGAFAHVDCDTGLGKGTTYVGGKPVKFQRYSTPLEIIKSVFSEEDYELFERALARQQNNSFRRRVGNKAARMLDKYRAAR